jgi:hypothetical protein
MPVRNHPRLARSPGLTFAGAAAGLVLVVAAGYAYLPMLQLVDERVAARAAMIEAASRDYTRASQDGCMSKGDEVEQPLCIYGDPNGQRRVILLGDSHADHWFPAWDAAASQTGWQLLSWARSSCPPVMRTIYVRGAPSLSCDRWQADILRRLTETEIPQVVVLSSYTNRENLPIYNGVDGSLPQREAADAWRAGFRETIRRLIAAGVTVVVLRDVPRADKSYRSCLLAGAACTLSRARALEHPAVEVEVASEFKEGVVLLDLNDAICGPKECHAQQNGVIVYRDSNHLTASFAATLAPKVAELLGALKYRRTTASVR